MNEEVAEFGIVECTSADPAVQSTFLDVVEWLLPADGRASVELVRTVFASLVRLFAVAQEAPRTSVLGLWGELWLIARSSDPSALASAWHLEPSDRWDFAMPALRLEVKTATGSRRHHFSLDQLTPPPGSRLYVASIVTAELFAGVSLSDLLEQIVNATADSKLRSRIVVTAMGSLGNAWASAKGTSYDASLAEATLRVLKGPAIPRVPDPPAEVSGVSFQVDVEDVDEVGFDSAIEPWLERVLEGHARDYGRGRSGS